jgi:hypothetical protein
MSCNPTLLWLCKEDLSAGWNILKALVQSGIEGTSWGSCFFFVGMSRKKETAVFDNSELSFQQRASLIHQQMTLFSSAFGHPALQNQDP